MLGCSVCTYAVTIRASLAFGIKWEEEKEDKRKREREVHVEVVGKSTLLSSIHQCITIPHYLILSSYLPP